MFFWKRKKSSLRKNETEHPSSEVESQGSPLQSQAKGQREAGSEFVIRADHPKESGERLNNPRRGWYQIFTFYADREFQPELIAGCFVEEETIALVRISIGAYRGKNLSEEACMRIRQILQYFKNQGKDVILRVIYDLDGKGMEHEPSGFSQVERHVGQLVPILSEFPEMIFIYQGVLVGSWGEMHNSKFLTKEKIIAIAEPLAEGLGKEAYLAVRKPSFYRMLHKKESLMPSAHGFLKKYLDHVCLFDDAIFGSETHLGTFGSQPAAVAGWENGWSREEELSFIDSLCSQVPNGGEVVYQEKFAKTASLEEMVSRLKRMHISYLNCLHDGAMLDLWREKKWESSDVFDQMNGFDYIERHLGYRYCIRKVSVGVEEAAKYRQADGAKKELQEKEKDLAVWHFEIENVGFAPVYQEVELVLSGVSDAGEIVQETVISVFGNTEGDGKLKAVRGSLGGWIEAEVRVRPLAGKYYLKMRTVSGGREILFGNCSREEYGVFVGEISLP